MHCLQMCDYFDGSVTEYYWSRPCNAGVVCSVETVKPLVT
jgi:hypothetical protein